MKPLALICSGIIFIMVVYFFSGTGDRNEAVIQPARTNMTGPVETGATGQIDFAEPESKTTNRDREPNEMPPSTATVLNGQGPSSLASKGPGLETSHAAMNGERAQKATDTPRVDDDVSRWIPRDWGLGSPSANASVDLYYQFESDFETVLDGNASVSIRSVHPVEPHWTAGIWQIVDAEAFRSQRLKYSGILRTESTSPEAAASAMLWLRADDEIGRVVAFQNSIGQFVSQEGAWSEAAIVIEIPATASSIHYGASLMGNGTAWVDRLSVESVDLTYPTTAPPYGRQTFNRVPNPDQVLMMPSNLGFELVIPHPEQ